MIGRMKLYIQTYILTKSLVERVVLARHSIIINFINTAKPIGVKYDRSLALIPYGRSPIQHFAKSASA